MIADINDFKGTTPFHSVKRLDDFRGKINLQTESRREGRHYL
jgi:hypothetical protein